MNVLIRNESGRAVGHCLVSLGASQLPVTNSVMVTVFDSTDTDSDSEETEGATDKSLYSSTSHLDPAETGDSEKASPRSLDKLGGRISTLVHVRGM